MKEKLRVKSVKIVKLNGTNLKPIKGFKQPRSHHMMDFFHFYHIYLCTLYIYDRGQDDTLTKGVLFTVNVGCLKPGLLRAEPSAAKPPSTTIQQILDLTDKYGWGVGDEGEGGPLNPQSSTFKSIFKNP
jgi:hypothetical protein